jgi:type VI secretion system secreted protein VgrG
MPQATAPVILHMGVFFDGTGNHFANDDDDSNVAKLFALYPHAPENHQSRLYIEGVGTQEGQADSLFALVTGKGSLGWKTAIDKAHRGIIEWLRSWIGQHPGRPIDRLQIDLFGFSRGAACARHFANDIHTAHDPDLTRLIRGCSVIGAASQYLPITIGFIGLFDTVVSVLGPGPQPRLRLSGDMARRIVHFVASDEHRHNFPLSSAAAYDLPLPGAHSDIGGGYPPQMQERLILTRPDGSYVAPHRPVESSPSYLRTAALLDQQATRQPNYGFDLQTRTWVKNIPGRRRGDRIEEVQVHAAIEGQRSVRNDLSRVYLHAMYQLAVAEGVPFKALPQADYPEELRPIVDKLLAYACGQSPTHGLTANEEALLYRRYIHHSHHWTCTRLGQTSDLDALFVHRPASGGKRRILQA